MSGRQVLQSTFDAIVREGITDFGLSPTEAVSDARAQLTAAGVTDQSNLSDPTSSGAADVRLRAAELLAALRADLAQPRDVPAGERLARRLEDHLARPPQELAAVFGAEGGVADVARALERGAGEVEAEAEAGAGAGKWRLADAAAGAVAGLARGNEANRGRFVGGDVDAVVCLRRVVEAGWRSGRAAAALRALRVLQRRSEAVKQRVAAGGFLETLLRAVAGGGAGGWAQFHAAAGVLRESLGADDATVQAGETFNRARVLGGGGGATASGLRKLSGAGTVADAVSRVAAAAGDDAVVGECVRLGRASAIADEVCMQLHAQRFHAAAAALLERRAGDARVVASCVGLLRNMSGRDAAKSAVFGEMGRVTRVVRGGAAADAGVAEMFCGLVGAVCLRRADVAGGCARDGAVEVVVQAMRTHAAARRAGCLALRNLCARCEAARERVRAAGGEAAVREAWREKGCDEVAYAALREMGALRDEEERRDERYTMPAGFFESRRADD